MTTAIEFIEGFLGGIFLITGSFKFFQSREKIIASGGKWAEDFKPGIVKALACTELICGILVIVPRLFGHGHYLTFISAACLAIIMAGAIYTHVKRKEFMHASINGVLLIMALFVAYASCPF